MNLSTITTILGLIPAIIQAIKAIEEAIPQSGQGVQKLAIIRTSIEAGYSAASTLWPALEKVISAIVAAFNASGVFAKAQAQA